ncbi:MAG: LysM peptidoglycan-binding domain-containing protein [Brevinematales bacterium]|nr:LysM peptidoglycan-binding domain-containing protein [Brevinematales bacterium]
MCLFILILLFSSTELFGIQYKVKENDTLWSISKRFGVNVELIEKLNEVVVLKSGQILFIPDNIEEYKVLAGESLIGISKKFNVEVRYLIILNNLKDEKIYEGQILKIPVSDNIAEEKKNKEYFFHIVEKGETLYSIAKNYGVSIENILKWNDKRSQNLFVGEKLKIYGERKLQREKIAVDNSPWQLPLKSRGLLEDYTKNKRGYVFYLKESSAIYCAKDGIVEYVGHINGYDKVVIIRSGEYKVVYGYLNEVYVKKGENLKKGDSIGMVDYHSFLGKVALYIEIRKGKKSLELNEIFEDNNLFARK